MIALVALLMFAAVLLCFPVVAAPAPVRRLSPLLVVPAALVLARGLSGSRTVLLVIVLASLADLARRFRRRRRRAEAVRRARQLLEACEAIASDLQAGLPPLRALEGAAADWAEFGVVLRAAQWGADVPEALRELGRLPGAEQSRLLAAAWQVAHRSGSGLASAVTVAATELREERATAAVVNTELAGARATATLLALLPAGMLLLGSGVGGDPIGFLVGTGPGLACLAAGLLLIHAGLAWIDAIADAVDR